MPRKRIDAANGTGELGATTSLSSSTATSSTHHSSLSSDAAASELLGAVCDVYAQPETGSVGEFKLDFFFHKLRWAVFVDFLPFNGNKATIIMHVLCIMNTVHLEFALSLSKI
jgi:hypothetical protein